MNGLNKEEARESLEIMERARRNCIGDFSLEYIEVALIKYFNKN